MPRYRLTGRLETGELAELYEGLRDERDRVVIKLFHAKTSDARYAQVIAGVSAQLASAAGDAIIQPVDLGMTGGRLALVREWLDGYTLGQALQRLATREVHPLPPPLALYLVVQLLDGAQRAHDAQTVHGAITPGNVVLGRDGRVALADFGALSALAAVPELKAFTQRGRGTYRAPEALQGAVPEPSSDIFSLGAIAYELLTLREPSRGKAVSTRNDALPPPSRLDRRINARLDPIIMRALEQAPARRFRSCSDMAQAIRNFLSASGGMPSRADVAKWVGDIFPPGIVPGPSPEVPFGGAFSLDPVEGAVLTASAVPLSAGVQEPSLIAVRPSFTHGAMPAVGGFEPSVEEPSSANTLDEVPAAEPDVPAQVTSWEAPPGEAPVKRRPAMGTGNSTAVPARPPAARARVRVSEEYGRSNDTEDDDGERSVVSRVRLRASTPEPRQMAPSAPSGVAASAPAPAAHVSASLADTVRNAPPVSHPRARPSAKSEADSPVLEQTRRRQRHFLAIAGAIALVGVFCLALLVWRFGGVMPEGEAGASTSEAHAVEGENPVPPEPPPATPERTVNVPVPLPRPQPGEELNDPSTSGAEAETGPAFLTLTSNVRAKVYLNGKAVRGHTPLRKVKVEPGTHKVAVVAVGSGERREFTKRFEPGQTVTVQERFEKSRRR